MENKDKLKYIIKNKKFNKSESLNKIVFVSKIGLIENNLIVVLKDEVMDKPINAPVEVIIKIEEEYYIYFDGKYNQSIEEEDYEIYSKLFTKEEWENLFKEKGILNILNEYTFEEIGYYLDIHENLSTVTEEYEIIDIEKVKRLF